MDATSASELEALRSLVKREAPLARLAHWLIDARTERLPKPGPGETERELSVRCQEPTP